MKQVKFVWETSSYDWFEAYVEKIEGMEKKENFWLWMCYQSACSKKLGLFPGKEKWAEILFLLEFANSVLLKYFVERLWLWQSFRGAHTCPKQSLSIIPWLPNKDSSTSNTSCSIFNFSGAHRPTISRLWDLLLSPVPRSQVLSIENLTFWSFAAWWNKTKILKSLWQCQRRLPAQAPNSAVSPLATGTACAGMWAVIVEAHCNAENGRLRRGKQQWWMDREAHPEECFLETQRCFSQLYCGLLQMGRRDDGA